MLHFQDYDSYYGRSSINEIRLAQPGIKAVSKTPVNWDLFPELRRQAACASESKVLMTFESSDGGKTVGRLTGETLPITRATQIEPIKFGPLRRAG